MEDLSNKINGIESENQQVKKGVDFVFSQNPELSSVGTIEEYSQYLETIFPDSKFREIVYHSSDAEFKNDGFKPMKPNFETLNSIEGVYNFSSNLEFAQRYGMNTYAVLLNTQKPIKEFSSGEYGDDMDRPLSEALFKCGKQTRGNVLAPEYDESLKDTDAVINFILGEDYVAKHPVTGKEIGLPRQTIASVFHADQIHILGSTLDTQKFQEFVKK